MCMQDMVEAWWPLESTEQPGTIFGEVCPRTRICRTQARTHARSMRARTYMRAHTCAHTHARARRSDLLALRCNALCRVATRCAAWQIHCRFLYVADGVDKLSMQLMASKLRDDGNVA